jgi:YidC/Oxa1 family membrane protein insertase
MPLFHWLSSFGMNMGIVLLLLTIIVKLLVYPSNKKSYMSSAKMRVLKPQVDALSAKYPNREDAMKKQQEMMQLYSQYGVSPMGGCLPMLLQMPIWYALFTFVPSAIELRGEKFLWAEDLSTYDDVIRWGHDVWLIGDHLSLFSILFLITTIISSLISMRQQQNQMSSEQAQQMKMMQYMMFIMPLMFFFMFNNYSSGLCFYFVVSSIATILITAYLRLTTDDAKLLKKLEAYREQHKNDPKKVSNLAARLEALQKMQAEQQAARKK